MLNKIFVVLPLMAIFLDKYFNKLFLISCIISFVVVCLRAFFIPFSHDEAATFFFYIQSDNYLPYKAHVYTNNHVLNSALANICYHIAGSHRFVLRFPNVLSFIVLCFGVYKMFRYLVSGSSKLLLTSLFILTLFFLDFFELCRGYGLSLAFMVLGISYLFDFFKNKQIKSLVFFTICWQLALSANLTLVVLTAMVLGYALMFQLKEKLFLKPFVILTNIINFVGLWFWVKFTFFYKEQGMLDSGSATGYWKTTFRSLMDFIFSSDSLVVQIIFILLFGLSIILFLRIFSKQNNKLQFLFSPFAFSVLIFIGLIIGFWILNKFMAVNFPEDRTALFYYVFFVLALVFAVDSAPRFIGNSIAFSITAFSIIFYLFNMSLENFGSYFYHTIPKNIYDYLKVEQAKNPEQFTIGGHRIREMDYAFLNYRGNAALNSMDDSEQMQMNCDYYFALQCEKPYYEKYYDEIMFDDKWKRVLLKRKERIEHLPVYELKQAKSIEGETEFFEFKSYSDTIFENKNPLEMEIKLNFLEAPKPLNAFVVFSIEDEQGNLIYKRTPLYWLQDHLQGTSKTLKLTSSNLPPKISKMAIYLWNIKKQKVKINVESLKIYQLKGKGVDVRIPEKFYIEAGAKQKLPLL